MVEVMAKQTVIPIDVTDDQQLYAEIERLAELRWSLLFDRKVSKANKISDKLRELQRCIPGLPDNGRRILAQMANSTREDLREIAAWNLIPLDRRAARKMLADLAKNASNVHIKITSRVTLEELDAGRVDYYGMMNLTPDGKLKAS